MQDAHHGDEDGSDGAGEVSPPDPVPETDATQIASIADLFLSDIRAKAQAETVSSGGYARPRPVRIPPGKASETQPVAARVAAEPELKTEGNIAASVEPMAGVFSISPGETLGQSVADEAVIVNGAVVVAPHVDAGQGSRGRVVAAIAATLANQNSRAGILHVEKGGAVLSLVDAGLPADSGGVSEVTEFKEVADAVGELSLEVDSWLVCPGDVDSSACAEVVRKASHWIVPVEAEDEGMVGAYRSIKTLAQGPRARLTLAAVGPEAQPAVEKLRAVMRRFLSWDADEVIITPWETNSESVLYIWSTLSQTESYAWRATAFSLLSKGGGFTFTSEEAVAASEEQPIRIPVSVERKPEKPVAVTTPSLTLTPRRDGELEVMDLVGSGDLGILDSVLAGASELKVCDVVPPGSLVARLAVEPSGRLVLLVALAGNTTELAEVGRVLNWVSEHAGLITRACGSLRIDPQLEPQARLYVATPAAQNLNHLLKPQAATLHTYRTLRWGEKRGLLVDAA